MRFLFSYIVFSLNIFNRSLAYRSPNQISAQRKSLCHDAAQITDYEDRINEYLNTREKMNLPPSMDAARGRRKNDSPLEMLRPTGWYRDETPEQARMREEVKRGPMAKFSVIYTFYSFTQYSFLRTQ